MVVFDCDLHPQEWSSEELASWLRNSLNKKMVNDKYLYFKYKYKHARFPKKLAEAFLDSSNNNFLKQKLVTGKDFFAIKEPQEFSKNFNLNISKTYELNLFNSFITPYITNFVVPLDVNRWTVNNVIDFIFTYVEEYYSAYYTTKFNRLRSWKEIYASKSSELYRLQLLVDDNNIKDYFIPIEQYLFKRNTKKQLTSEQELELYVIGFEQNTPIFQLPEEREAEYLWQVRLAVAQYFGFSKKIDNEKLVSTEITKEECVKEMLNCMTRIRLSWKNEKPQNNLLKYKCEFAYKHAKEYNYNTKIKAMLNNLAVRIMFHYKNTLVLNNFLNNFIAASKIKVPTDIRINIYKFLNKENFNDMQNMSNFLNKYYNYDLLTSNDYLLNKLLAGTLEQTWSKRYGFSDSTIADYLKIIFNSNLFWKKILGTIRLYATGRKIKIDDDALKKFIIAGKMNLFLEKLGFIRKLQYRYKSVCEQFNFTKPKPHEILRIYENLDNNLSTSIQKFELNVMHKNIAAITKDKMLTFIKNSNLDNDVKSCLYAERKADKISDEDIIASMRGCLI